MTSPAVDHLLIAGLDDCVSLARALDFALEFMGLDSVDEAERVGLLPEALGRMFAALYEAFEGGLMEVGDVAEAPGGGAVFVPWELSVEEALDRAREFWDAGERAWVPEVRTSFGWLRNTPLGDAVGRTRLAARWFSHAELVGVWRGRYRSGFLQLVLKPNGEFSASVGLREAVRPSSFAGQWSYGSGFLELRPFCLFSGLGEPINLEREQLAAYRDPLRGALVLGREIELRKEPPEE